MYKITSVFSTFQLQSAHLLHILNVPTRKRLSKTPLIPFCQVGVYQNFFMTDVTNKVTLGFERNGTGVKGIVKTGNFGHLSHEIV